MAPSTSPHSKPCTLCATPRDVLVRCQIDSSGRWHSVCPGSCWKRVSGGMVDGDGKEAHRWYRYGGMWKNKHEGVSAKKRTKKKKKEGRGVVGKEEMGKDGGDAGCIADQDEVALEGDIEG